MRCTFVFVCDVLCDVARLVCVFVFCGVRVCGCGWFCHVLCAVCDLLRDDVCVVVVFVNVSMIVVCVCV